MKTFFYLSTCDTCKKIMKDLNLENFNVQDIKSKPITASQLEELKNLAGSYEALFSKRAQLYKKLDLKNKDLKEEDYKTYLLEHYTFLKRPVLVSESEIYVGNSPKTKTALKEKFGKL